MWPTIFGWPGIFGWPTQMFAARPKLAGSFCWASAELAGIVVQVCFSNFGWTGIGWLA